MDHDRPACTPGPPTGTREVLVTLDETGTVVHAGPGCRALLGRDPAALVGRPFAAVVAPPNREALERRLTAGSTRALEILALREDGSERLLEVRLESWEAGGRAYRTGVLRDASQRRTTERALAISEQRYREVFERNVAGVYRITLDGRVVEMNDAMARMLGHERGADLVGASTPEMHARPADRARWLAALRERGALTNYELQLRRADGSTIWILENASLLDDPVTGEPAILGTAIDVTRQKALQTKLTRMAYHDPLTGLANRRLLMEMADKALASAARAGHRVGVVYVDVSRFKRVNDALGHAVGDLVLVEVGQRLVAAVRKSDTVARVGGDEFAVLLARIQDLAEARAVAERVKRRFEAPFVVGGEAFHLDGRLGLALYPDHADDFGELLTIADLSMAHANGNIADAVACGLVAASPRREDFDLEEDLRRAIEERNLSLHVQRVFSLPGREPVGGEALARWEHPSRGTIPAAEFIALAERTGRVRAVDGWALETAARTLAAWGTGAPDWISVNLSPASFEDPDLPVEIERVLADTGLAGERLILEVTERVAMRDPDHAVATLAALRALGVRIAIDDFGRGHSSLAYLLHFEADILKVDRLFVHRLGADPAHERLVEGILALGHELGMSLVAEGVERPEQLAWLEDRACDYAQGYHLARPAPAHALV